ncbi:unnamed protein product [Boreogadus saida]
MWCVTADLHSPASGPARRKGKSKQKIPHPLALRLRGPHGPQCYGGDFLPLHNRCQASNTQEKHPTTGPHHRPSAHQPLSSPAH